MSRVLVVEDEETLGGTLRDLIESEGHEVDVATNGADALRRVADRKPDLVLLDYMLPIVDGAEFLRRLTEEQRAGMRVVVMTSAPREALGRAPYDDFVAKPLRIDDVLRLLGGHAA